ncbi:condensation domain-containing protein [Paenibacillus larvae]|nr:condensation domain-containing protein [Paenibacillus larvae]MDT2260980.1 condensation domain-containing protein [Paenibacillus larvae]
MNELVRRNIQDIYKMAPTQEGMYFHYLLDKSSLAYLEQTTYRLHGDLDITRVKQSLEELFKRYDILRTVFNHEKADLPSGRFEGKGGRFFLSGFTAYSG